MAGEASPVAGKRLSDRPPSRLQPSIGASASATAGGRSGSTMPGLAPLTSASVFS